MSEKKVPSHHIWLVESKGDKRWFPTADYENNYRIYMSKKSAVNGMKSVHLGHPKGLRVRKYIREV